MASTVENQLLVLIIVLYLIAVKKVTGFERKVYNVIRTIKRGRIMTYTEIARAIGNPKAARAVGNALSKNTDRAIPCHRVIRSDGKVGNYNKGRKAKLALLRKEGAIKQVLGVRC